MSTDRGFHDRSLHVRLGWWPGLDRGIRFIDKERAGLELGMRHDLGKRYVVHEDDRGARFRRFDYQWCAGLLVNTGDAHDLTVHTRIDDDRRTNGLLIIRVRFLDCGLNRFERR